MPTQFCYFCNDNQETVQHRTGDMIETICCKCSNLLEGYRDGSVSIDQIKEIEDQAIDEETLKP